MFQGRYIEFFESERRLGMSNLSHFVSTFIVNLMIPISIFIAPALTSEFLLASVSLAGFSYATNKIGNAWQNIRTVQAENKIQPQPPTAPQPNLTQNINMSKTDEPA